MHGFVSIIKNSGLAVGGSLAHGHQQIALSNVMPRRVYEHWKFEQKYGLLFSEYLLEKNPQDLIIRDFEEAVLFVPYFMRRPFDMVLAVKDTRKAYLHELELKELEAVAKGWKDATWAINQIMLKVGKEVNYSVITNNGLGTGLYFEFLPYTQEDGGFEHLGLSVCQAEPVKSAAQLRMLFYS